jgi:hypothetical protein
VNLIDVDIVGSQIAQAGLDSIAERLSAGVAEQTVAVLA